MRGFLVLLFILLGALASGHLAITKANADTGSFLAAAEQAGYNPADPATLRDAYLVCATKAEPAASGSFTTQLLRQAIDRVTDGAANSQAFIDAAVTHICPETQAIKP